MPTIPTGNEGQRVDQRSPVEAYDVADAGRGARMVGAVGTGLSNLGEGLIDYGRNRDREKQARIKIDVAVLEEEADRRALEDHNMAIRKSKADGSDIVDQFNGSYEPWMKSRLDQIEDPDVRQAAASKLMNRQNWGIKDLSEKGRAKFVTFGTERATNVLDQATSYAFSNPDDTTGITNQLYRGTKMVTDGELLDASSAEKLRLTYQQETAKKRIQGYVAQGRFQDAQKTLNTSLLGYFNSDELQKQNDFIDKSQQESLNRKWTTYQRNETLSQRAQKDTQDKYYMDIFSRQAGGQDVASEIELGIGQGTLRTEQYNSLVKRNDNFDQLVSSGTRVNLLLRAYQPNSDIDALVMEAADARNPADPNEKQKLSNGDANSLIPQLYALKEKRKDKKSQDPQFQRVLKSNEKIIESAFGATYAANSYEAQFSSPKDKERAEQAKIRFYGQVYGKGMNTIQGMETARKNALKEWRGTSDSISSVPAITGVPAALFNDPNAVKDALRKRQKEFDNGQIDRKTLLQDKENAYRLKKIREENDRARGWEKELE